MARRPNPWKLAIEALTRIDQKAETILAMRRVPRPIRELMRSIREEDVAPVLRREGR